MGVAREPLPGFWSQVRLLPRATPGAYAPLRLAASYGLFERPARLPAAIAGIAAVAGAFLLAHRISGGPAAVATGLLVAVAPLSVAASRLALPATLSASASLLAAWLLCGVLRGGSGAAAAALALVAALACGWSALAVTGGGLIAVAIGRLTRRLDPGASRRALAVVAVALLCFSPWALYDLPSEVFPQHLSPGGGWGAPMALLTRAATFLPGEARAQAALVGALALAGMVALRRDPVLLAFVVSMLAAAVAAALVPAAPIRQQAPAASLLLAQALALALAAAGLHGLARRVGGERLAAAVVLGTAFGLTGWTIASPAPLEPAGEDWRGSFAVVQANLGRDDRVAAPLAAEAVAFYGTELPRRLPPTFKPAPVAVWLDESPQSWLIARWSMRFGHWDQVRSLLDRRFVIDLSPSSEPAVLYLGRERRWTYRLACHFELPAEVLARQPLLRDCLREIGAEEGVLRQLRTLLSNPGPSLRNPALLESVTLLVEAGRTAEAHALAQAVAEREPDWLPAQQALVTVRDATVSP